MVRFTDAEYASISISAEQAGYPVAVYVRKSALDERIEVHYNITVNEQIHYLGQYLSTKSTYNEFLKARFKGKFRKDHADEIERHEKAAQILKAQNPDGSLPKMKDLKLEKERLLALKAAQYDTYTYYKDYQKELRTACANVDNILGQHYIRDHIQRTEQTL